MGIFNAVIIVNEDRICRYKVSLYQKTGFLLGRIAKQARISDEFIEFCSKKGTNNVKRLTNEDISDTYDKKWNLYIPLKI